MDVGEVGNRRFAEEDLNGDDCEGGGIGVGGPCIVEGPAPARVVEDGCR